MNHNHTVSLLMARWLSSTHNLYDANTKILTLANTPANRYANTQVHKYVLCVAIVACPARSIALDCLLAFQADCWPTKVRWKPNNRPTIGLQSAYNRPTMTKSICHHRVDIHCCITQTHRQYTLHRYRSLYANEASTM